MRRYDCANYSILCIYGILFFLYLVSFKLVVIIPMIFAALKPIMVTNMLYISKMKAIVGVEVYEVIIIWIIACHYMKIVLLVL